MLHRRRSTGSEGSKTTIKTDRGRATTADSSLWSCLTRSGSRLAWSHSDRTRSGGLLLTRGTARSSLLGMVSSPSGLVLGISLLLAVVGSPSGLVLGVGLLLGLISSLSLSGGVVASGVVAVLGQ